MASVLAQWEPVNIINLNLLYHFVMWSWSVKSFGIILYHSLFHFTWFLFLQGTSYRCTALYRLSSSFKIHCFPFSRNIGWIWRRLSDSLGIRICPNGWFSIGFKHDLESRYTSVEVTNKNILSDFPTMVVLTVPVTGTKVSSTFS